MAPAVTITVLHEGFFKKTFRFSKDIKLKKVLDLYRTYVCDDCSDAVVLDFWFETTKVMDGHTADMLSMKTGDIIDVRLSKQCTLGACPINSLQTQPNLHYLEGAELAKTPQVSEVRYQPIAPSRNTLKMRDINGFEMVFQTRRDSELIHAMQTFASCVRKEVQDCRFWLDGERLSGENTPGSLKLENDDLIQVGHEAFGGGYAN